MYTEYTCMCATPVHIIRNEKFFFDLFVFDYACNNLTFDI